MGQTLTQEERLIARVLFVNQLLKANNHAFQQLFWAVMRAKHGQEFVEVRPQGRLGDGGNDGYLPAEGHYFQVYGPIDPQEKETEAAKKLAKDFEKLKISWDQTTPIQAYSFVFNDKYEGTFKMIAQALGEIGKANPTVSCRPFTAAHLEDTFLSLSADRIQDVLGMLLPDPAKIIRLDYGVLKEVVIHIMNSPSRATPTRFGDFPELAEKIQLNNLCSAWGDLIRKGARQSGHVDNYFSKNSTFMKQALRDHLVEHYQRVRDAKPSPSALSEGISREDLVFDDFRQALLPVNATVAEEGAVATLIGYYFETCDVFDQRADKGTPNAST
jgi:hypothetical protein